MIQIRFRDIDPDTGFISNDKLIATCETEQMAAWVLQALSLLEEEANNPNREIYKMTLSY